MSLSGLSNNKPTYLPNIKINDIQIFSKVYNYVISLGEFCHTSTLMKEIKIKKFSGPFDWILISNNNILDCLADNFTNFSDKKYYIDNTTAINKNNTAGHSLYRNNMFYHHDPRKNDDYQYFIRCVNRFKEVIKTPHKKLFIQMIHYNIDAVDNFNYHTLNRYYENYKTYITNFNILFIVNKSTGYQNSQVIFDHQDNDNTGFSVIRINTKSRTTGTVFPDDSDNKIFSDLFKKINLDYIYPI